MAKMYRDLLIETACLVAMTAPCAWAAPFTFDDIDYWVGSGSKRAAMAIDWVDDNAQPPALVWGYRWDGTATGYDMLLAIVQADDRLFAKVGTIGGPVVFGLGYDTDNDGEFGILKIDIGGEPVETVFDASGIAVSGIPDQDHRRAAATDPGDFYGEGWRDYFWHYGTETTLPGGAPTNPFNGGSWKDSGSGSSFRTLQDGSWDSWAYEAIPPGAFVFNAYAENPLAAAPPYPPGDFNHDTKVDAADYQLWKSEFSMTGALASDGNGNGVVDAADFTVWRDHLGTGTTAGAGANTSHAVPEPTSPCFGFVFLYLFWQRLFPQRKE